MLVDHLSDGVAKQNDVLVKRLNLALKLDAIDQINGNWHVLTAQGVEEGILQKLPFVVHDILRVLKKIKGFTLTQAWKALRNAIFKNLTNQSESLSA